MPLVHLATMKLLAHLAQYMGLLDTFQLDYYGHVEESGQILKMVNGHISGEFEKYSQQRQI